MKNNLLQLKLIPPVVAILLGFFVIFPDIVLKYSHQSFEDFPRMERPLDHSFDDFGPDAKGLQNKPNQEKSSLEPNKPGFPGDLFSSEIPPQSANWWRILHEFIFFVVFAYVLMLIDLELLRMKRFSKIGSISRSLYILLINLILGIIGALINTLFLRDGFNWNLDGIITFKSLFIALTTYLIVYLRKLLIRQQRMMVENERLKTQNIEVQYESLTTQLNPHFFFNSLNSLSSLIRNSEKDKSLKYVQKLSEMFRYLLSANKYPIVTLKDEMEMLEAYRYMMEIRFEDKLLFDIDIDEKYLKLLLPILTIQPLIENVIKHNEISEDRPMTVALHVNEENQLVVSNVIHPKLLKEESTGLGIRNLQERYKLLFDENIIILDDKRTFTLKLPLFEEKNIPKNA